MKACSASTATGTLWQVDPALRPEGKAGPLVRTVASHRSYYERWAKTWEFQALLKARVVAGDREVGAGLLDALQPMVWGRPPDPRELRRGRPGDAPTGRGSTSHPPRPPGSSSSARAGCATSSSRAAAPARPRPHRRELRSGTTLRPAALARGLRRARGRRDARRGIPAAAHAGTPHPALPPAPHPPHAHRARTCAASAGRSVTGQDPAEAVVAQWQAQQREVRRLHERLFYRPLLSAVARLSEQRRVRLTPEAARERCPRPGFPRSGRGLRHLEASPTGSPAGGDPAPPVAGHARLVRRRGRPGRRAARLPPGQRRARHHPLVPADAARRGQAAERLAHVLARSRFAADLLEQAPESVQILGDPAARPTAACARGRPAPDAVRRRAQGRPEHPPCSPPAPSADPSSSASRSPT
jgi:glutamate-ammonia-ligase adenylyltransferase